MKQLNSQTGTLFLMLLLFILPAMAFSQEKGSISGQVSDETGQTILEANVIILGTSKAVSTGADGGYAFSNLSAGSYTIRVSNIGYKSSQKDVSVKEGENLTVNLRLEVESQSLKEVVVTGSSSPRSKLESSVAITTMGAKTITDRAPMSTADLLQAIPGFVAESSGGEVGNNLFARGIPSAGAYEYVQIQEDGLPVFEDGALQFANIDNFYRLDGTLKNMEAVRGGSAAIYASGAPGGIINFISKTGQNDTKGTLALSTSNYGLMKADFNLGGAIKEDKLFFNIGGFYRQDNGIRDPGYTANKGGQFKMNLTYKFDEGFARVYYKKLNDRNIFYQVTPFVKEGNKVKEYGGFDANYGTFASKEMTRLRVPQIGGGYFEANLEDGVHPVVDAIGTEFNYNITPKVKVKNAFRHTTIDQDYNAIFAPSWMGGIQTQSQYVTGQTDHPLTIANAEFTYVSGGEKLDASTKLKRADLWFIKKKMNNFVNNLSFSFDLDPIKLNVGYYYSNWTSKQYWNWNSYLATASDKPRLVNLKDVSTGMNYTYNGVSQITWLERDAQINGTVNAFFADADFKASDDLNFNVGFRYDTDKYSGYRDNAKFFSTDLGVLTGSYADDKITTIDGNPYTYWTYKVNELSYSVAANYKLNDNMATYARASHGFRAPIEESFYDNASDLSKLEPTKINQYELGYKGSLGNFNVIASGFLMNLNNIAYQDIGAGGASEGKFADVQNIGMEIEVAANMDKFHLAFNGTFQSPKYRNYEGSQAALNGNIARRIPKMYFTVRPDYNFTKQLNGYAKFSYFGKKYQDIENKFELPAFNVLDLGLSYKIKNLRFGVDATNVLNTIGLTEGDGGAPNDGDVFFGRSILGSAIRGSVSIEF
jgi:iron complex outermembrane receptor protein